MSVQPWTNITRIIVVNREGEVIKGGAATGLEEGIWRKYKYENHFFNINRTKFYFKIKSFIPPTLSTAIASCRDYKTDHFSLPFGNTTMVSQSVSIAITIVIQHNFQTIKSLIVPCTWTYCIISQLNAESTAWEPDKECVYVVTA